MFVRDNDKMMVLMVISSWPLSHGWSKPQCSGAAEDSEALRKIRSINMNPEVGKLTFRYGQTGRL